METNATVKTMRETRERISQDTAAMDFKEFKKYMDRERSKNKRAKIGKMTSESW